MFSYIWPHSDVLLVWQWIGCAYKLNCRWVIWVVVSVHLDDAVFGSMSAFLPGLFSGKFDSCWNQRSYNKDIVYRNAWKYRILLYLFDKASDFCAYWYHLTGFQPVTHQADVNVRPLVSVCRPSFCWMSPQLALIWPVCSFSDDFTCWIQGMLNQN